MSQTVIEPKKARVPLNGVDTPNLFATIDVVRNNPPLAKFQFRAKNRWVSGTHSRGTIETFYGAGSEHPHGAGGRNLVLPVRRVGLRPGDGGSLRVRPQEVGDQ
jgi:hypothetical protein